MSLGAPNSASLLRRPIVRDLVEILILALMLYVGISSCIETVRVQGCSMAPTLQNNDLLVASKISYVLGSPKRGDIVIFPPGPQICGPVNGANCDFIKRIIGLPGDVIQIDVNPQTGPEVEIKPGGHGPFQVLNEPYLSVVPPSDTNPPVTSSCTDGIPADGTIQLPEAWSVAPYCCTSKGLATNKATPVTVPPNEYFVLGDDRNHSEDSRFIGFIPRSEIQAMAAFRIWPPFTFSLGPGPTLLPALGLAVPLWFMGSAVPTRRRRRRRR